MICPLLARCAEQCDEGLQNEGNAMSGRIKPPFRADHVGSLLRPQRLRDARAAFEKGLLARAELSKIEDEAIREAVKLQEDAGLKAATDGEFRRRTWHMDFLKQFANVTETKARVNMRFHTKEGDINFTAPALKASAN